MKKARIKVDKDVGEMELWYIADSNGTWKDTWTVSQNISLKLHTT